MATPSRSPAAPEVSSGPVVPHNRWDLLDVPELGAWKPTLRVSVVLPAYRNQAELDLTLAGLAEQTYPTELIEIVVADDGSDPPIEVPGWPDGPRVQVVRQPDEGFGAGRARNLGARHATGDVLVFLDADMIPEPRHLEAHLRWHHAHPLAVTLGVRRHVDVDDLDPRTLRQVLRRDGELGSFVAGRPQQVPTWIDGHLERTAQLRSADDDLFRVVTSGNLGVPASLFATVGGFDEAFDRWGGEDTELGYRLLTAGGLLVCDPVARCWHQGHGHEPTLEEARSLEEQRALLAHRIAHRGFRRTSPGRSYLVPRLAASVRADGPTADVVATVESVLASEVHDLEVLLDVPDDHPEALWLRRQFGEDPRVRLGDEPSSLAVPHRAVVPCGAVLEPSALGTLLGGLTDAEEPVGLLEVTVPRRRPREVRVRAWTTRAAARIRAAGVGDDEVLDQVAAVFGARWLAGSEVGVRWRADDVTDLAVDHAAPRRSAAGTQHDAQRLWERLGQLDPASQRAVLGAADTALTQLSPGQLRWLLRLGRRVLLLLGALRALVAARSLPALRTATRRVLVAVVPTRLARPLRRWRARQRRS